MGKYCLVMFVYVPIGSARAIVRTLCDCVGVSLEVIRELHTENKFW